MGWLRDGLQRSIQQAVGYIISLALSVATLVAATANIDITMFLQL